MKCRGRPSSDGTSATLSDCRHGVRANECPGVICSRPSRIESLVIGVELPLRGQPFGASLDTQQHLSSHQKLGSVEERIERQINQAWFSEASIAKKQARSAVGLLREEERPRDVQAGAAN